MHDKLHCFASHRTLKIEENQATEFLGSSPADQYSDIEETRDLSQPIPQHSSQDSVVQLSIQEGNSTPEINDPSVLMGIPTVMSSINSKENIRLEVISEAIEVDHSQPKLHHGGKKSFMAHHSDDYPETSPQINKAANYCILGFTPSPVKYEDPINRILSPPPSPSISTSFPAPSLPSMQHPLPSFNSIPSQVSTLSTVIPDGSPKAQPHNTIPVSERKSLIVSSSRPSKVTKDMHQWYSKTSWLLDPFLDNSECWFHPSPPPARLTASGLIRPCGNISKRFRWNGDGKTHSLVLNYGIVVKLLYNTMTKQQQDGFIYRQWHLSHLCGNWTCLNPRHTTVEPGAVNLSRNNCFSHRAGCLHKPACLKELKMPLGTDGKIVDQKETTRSTTHPEKFDDWATNTFVEEEELMDTVEERNEESVPEALSTQANNEAEGELQPGSAVA
ncbi:hypothetical protein B0J14DRAFT_569080 [Halenospora varia]|nr:hypothetical protein B0J14DRAFT_569080 [Halenospora varia]